MPRRNQRSQRTEELNVRRHVAWELARRGWSQQTLADRLSAAGNPVSKTAVHKLLEQEPPRRLNVNEFAALADVFGVTPAELLTDRAAFLSKEANKVIADLERARQTLQHGIDAFEKAVGDARSLLVDGDQRSQHVTELLQKYEASRNAVIAEFLDAKEAAYGIGDEADSSGRSRCDVKHQEAAER